MKTKLLHWGTIVLMLFVFASCSNGSKMKSLLKAIPADADCVLVGDVETVLNSAGGSIEESKVKLPVYISDLFSNSQAEDFDEFCSFLKISGIKLDVCAVMGRYADNRPYVVFELDDSDKFLKAIENEDFDEWEKNEDITCYQKLTYESDIKDYNRYDFIVVNGDVAYWIESVRGDRRDEVWRQVRKMISSADEKSFADMDCGKYIAEGNAIGLSVSLPRELRRELKNAGLPADLVNVYEGRVCMKGDLTEKSAKLNMKFFTENGEEKKPEEFAKFMDVNATINTDALSFLPQDENFVYAASLKNFDWDDYMDFLGEVSHMSHSERSVLRATKSYLNKIDGTVAFGLGIKDLKEMLNVNDPARIMENISFTMLCETKEGKAKGLINDFKGLLDSQGGNVEYQKTANGLTLELPNGMGKLYVEAQGNMLILSNKSIKKGAENPTVKACDFRGKIAACGFTLPKNSSLIRDLDVRNGIEAKCSFDVKELEASLELVLDGEESVGFLENCAKSVQRAAKKGEQLKNEWEEQRYSNETNNYGSSNDWDYAIADTVVVDSAAADYVY